MQRRAPPIPRAQAVALPRPPVAAAPGWLLAGVALALALARLLSP